VTFSIADSVVGSDWIELTTMAHRFSSSARPGLVVPHDPADHEFVDPQPADVQLAGATALESEATDRETADGNGPEGHGAHGKRPV
jgi:hypothetical protein